MTKKWLHWLNLALTGLVLLALVGAALLAWLRPQGPEPKLPVIQTQQLPSNAFEQPKEAYQQLNEGLIKLKVEPPAVQLPNLRTVLTYYGKNGRPDADPEKPLMHFGLAGSKDSVSIPANQPLYMVYDRTAHPPKYIFSPHNAATPLWIEAAPHSTNQAAIQLFLRNQDGSLVRKPQANAYFLVAEKEYARFGGTAVWEIDKARVDGTLLVRQKARWYGSDRFLARHGGELYGDAGNKQRIDFGEGDDSYSVFVDENTCLIWKDGRWVVATPGPATLPYPLLCVRKIDTRLMNFELWDINGRNKVILNLLKTTDAAPPKILPQNIKFLGARTLSRFLFEVNNERVVLTPHEWLIFKDNRWNLLRDPQEVQRFVDRKLIAPLFVFDGVVRREDRQVLQGTLFNSSRTESTLVEIPLLSGGTAKPATAKTVKKSDDKSATSTPAIPSTPPRSIPQPSPANLPPANPQGAENAAQGIVSIPLPSREIDDDDDDDEDDDDDDGE